MQEENNKPGSYLAWRMNSMKNEQHEYFAYS